MEGRTYPAPVMARAAAGSGKRTLVVPRDPGPLRDLSRLEHPRHDVDAAIDEMFGTSMERPGVFDVVLLALGVGLIGWAWLVPGSTLLLILGVGAVLLAAALPGHVALVAVSARRADRRRRVAIGQGYPLDAGAPGTAELVDAYAELLQATNVGGPLPVELARDAGHLAVVECALLLEGRAPLVPEEMRYVARRTQAIRDLSADLLGAHRDWLERRAADAHRRATSRATAAVAAVEEQQATYHASSVVQLRRVSRALRRGSEDGPEATVDDLSTAVDSHMSEIRAQP